MPGSVRVLTVVGNRPQFIKAAAVSHRLRETEEEVLVHTGQHYDEELSQVFFTELGIPRPEHRLDLGGGSNTAQTARMLAALVVLIPRERPELVLVYGDTNSTLAGALVAAKLGLPLAHVESGLRSFDMRMPEEVNRVVTDRLSDLLFAPSPDGADNLRAEGYHDDQIRLAGNVMIDTLYANLDRALASDALHRHGLTPGGYALATLHRPANVDTAEMLAGLLRALGEVARDLPVVLPVHPRTAARLESVGLPAGIRLVPPAGYLDFIALQASARLVLTDSGGVQEETTALGVPCLTMRDSTERPITVTEGTNVLVGRDPGRIVATARRVLADPPAKRTPALWDGHAGVRIADALLAHLAAPARLRPTDAREPVAGLPI